MTTKQIAATENLNKEMREHVRAVLASVIGLSVAVTLLILAANFGVWAMIGRGIASAWAFSVSALASLWTGLVDAIWARNPVTVVQGLVGAAALLGSTSLVFAGYAMLNPAKPAIRYTGLVAGQVSVLSLMAASIIAMSIRVAESSDAGIWSGLAFFSVLGCGVATPILAVAMPRKVGHYRSMTVGMGIWSGSFSLVMLGSSTGVYLPGFGFLALLFVGLAVGHLWLDEYRPDSAASGEK